MRQYSPHGLTADYDAERGVFRFPAVSRPRPVEPTPGPTPSIGPVIRRAGRRRPLFCARGRIFIGLAAGWLMLFAFALHRLFGA